ncbi:MAG: NADH:flavin oxidoreductase [Opitutae bacterium]
MKYGDFKKLTAIKTTDAFIQHLTHTGIEIPCDESMDTGETSPLLAPIDVDGMRIGNRFVAQPMEGWDCETDGAPTDATFRRWTKFGKSGAKLIFGGEAAAVRPDGRANPRQLIINEKTKGAVAKLKESARKSHVDTVGSESGWVCGLQLTHSGRFCKPNDNSKFEPFILYRHPVLDKKFGTPGDYPIMTDSQISYLVDDYILAAKHANDVGFDFVDIKHCHGYLGHEFLGAKTRPGLYGGSLENRTRFLRETVAGIRANCPELKIAVRVSALDLIAFKPGPAVTEQNGPTPGMPVEYPSDSKYQYGFGVNADNPTEFDTDEMLTLFDVFKNLGIRLINVTLGSPYYNPHLVRPAAYPPSDGYTTPEDPLIGVMRHLEVVRKIKAVHPEFYLVGSGYSYLQEYLPFVAQAVVRNGWTDFVGIGRMMLTYPEIFLDALNGHVPQRKKFCRTFSDCTTAPRNNLISGCYPLDPYYKESGHFETLSQVKKAAV